jgi:large subunit ribosomal protein L21e
MATRIGGARRKTRQKYSKNYKLRGKISQRRFLQVLTVGDKVSLLTEPAVQTGMYHRRFHGKVGAVTKRLGQCYEVTIRDHDKTKKLIVHPVHLKKVA